MQRELVGTLVERSSKLRYIWIFAISEIPANK